MPASCATGRCSPRQRARRKVYILDEVHMASTAAFNALLKLIEEPPDHVLFVMATTDPQKVIPTILSRVQRLDLRRVGALGPRRPRPHGVRLLEGYTIDDGRGRGGRAGGDGSVRDTLSVLEQVLAFAGREVHAAAVAQALGTTPAKQVLHAVELLAREDVAGLLALVHDLLESGHDLRRFTLDLVGHLRDLLVLQVAGEDPDLVDATDQWRARLAEQTHLLDRVSVLRAVDVLAATLAEQRQGPPRLPLELALATLATPAAASDPDALADRLARLERRVDATPLAGPGPASDAAPAPGRRREPGGAPLAPTGTAERMRRTRRTRRTRRAPSRHRSHRKGRTRRRARRRTSRPPCGAGRPTNLRTSPTNRSTPWPPPRQWGTPPGSMSRPPTSRPRTNRRSANQPLTHPPRRLTCRVMSPPLTSRPLTSRPLTSRPLTSRALTSREPRTPPRRRRRTRPVPRPGRKTSSLW
jgi:DNA polymerase III subunit gamma/tau